MNIFCEIKAVQHCAGRDARGKLISNEALMKSFFKSQFPHNSVNLFSIFAIVKDDLTDLCGNCPLKNDFINTFCEIKTGIFHRLRSSTPTLCHTIY